MCFRFPLRQRWGIPPPPLYLIMPLRLSSVWWCLGVTRQLRRLLFAFPRRPVAFPISSVIFSPHSLFHGGHFCDKDHHFSSVPQLQSRQGNMASTGPQWFLGSLLARSPSFPLVQSCSWTVELQEFSGPGAGRETLSHVDGFRTSELPGSPWQDQGRRRVGRGAPRTGAGPCPA